MKNNLAVIVLNYNDPSNTIKYVNTIKKYDCIDRIIVIDNLSPDGSFEKLKKLRNDTVDVIESNGNRGYAYGNNFAVKYLIQKYGEFKYIAISNPDVEVPEESYKKCLEFLNSNNDVAIAAPRMYDINDKPHQLSGWKIRSLRGDIMDTSLCLTELYQLPHIERYTDKKLNKKAAYVECVAGSFFIIRYEAFEKVGYFDEGTFLYFEEDILGNKLKKAGYKNVVLNDCKFKHFESVTIDKNMNFMKKFKNLQKSKRYYHKNYNIHATWWKLLILDFFTWFRGIEEKINIAKLFRIYRRKVGNGMINGLVKVLILILSYIFLPISYISKKLRSKERVLYFSLVTWKWIKQRPHFVALELAQSGDFKVDYVYQTLYDKYMPDQNHLHVKNKVTDFKNFKIKPFKIFPANSKFRIRLNSTWNLIRTSMWNYDKIIITHPNQIDFFFMKVQKLKGTKFYYECMDNYEEWEENCDGFREKQQRVISASKHVIVSSMKLKQKLCELYHIDESLCTVIRNGYDKKLFNNYKKYNTKLKKPNVTYIGTIDDWFDFENIVRYAQKNPKINFDIIGPINDNLNNVISNIKEKNIKFHGPIEHEKVPSYIEDSDVMIMPFIVNDIIEYVDPVKMYEYLYLKKPVVTTYWKELDQFKEFVLFYNNDKEFFKAIDNSFNFNVKDNKKYCEIMKNSDWNERLKDYVKIVK